jgi:hypothetical protein
MVVKMQKEANDLETVKELELVRVANRQQKKD